MIGVASTRRIRSDVRVEKTTLPRQPTDGDGQPEALLRYRYADGQLQAALPMHVVQDGPKLVVAWLAPGTQIMYWALPDGRDPRVLPVSERFTTALSTAERTWQGHGVLRVIPIAEPYQVIHFWNHDGTFAGWYVNLEAPKIRSGARLDTVDWHLDLWISAEGTPTWKDEDEAQAAVAAGHFRQQDLDRAWSTGQAIVDRLGDWPSVIGDWRAFTAPAEWTALKLPGDWAE